MTSTRCKNKDETDTLIRTICQAIVDKSGTNVIVIDVRKVSNFTDYFIIAQGTVGIHIRAIYHHIEEVLEKQDKKVCCIEGVNGDWIVLDLSNIIVHLFTSDMRSRYRLEEVWKEGELVDVPISYDKE